MGNSPLWGNSASNLCSSDWEAGVLNNIEILYELNNSHEFLFKQWHDNINRILKYHPKETPNILRVNMKAEDKPKYILELREIISKLDIEKLIMQPNQALTNQGIYKAKAIFTNFDYTMGEQLQTLINNLLKFKRLDDSKEIRHFAEDIKNLIIQKTEEMGVYLIDNTEKNLITKETSSVKVFIVHGQNESIRESVARFLEKLELEPIILHEQPNKGRTIIEKFLAYSDVSFAVVLLTADDRGGSFSGSYEQQKPRARQNVIFELGFFLGTIGRNRVCVIYEEGVEILSDYQGVLFIKMDKGSSWKFSLAKEMKEAGLQFNKDNIL